MAHAANPGTWEVKSETLSGVIRETELQGKMCFKKQTQVITRAIKMAQRALTINLANLSLVTGTPMERANDSHKFSPTSRALQSLTAL